MSFAHEESPTNLSAVAEKILELRDRNLIAPCADGEELLQSEAAGSRDGRPVVTSAHAVHEALRRRPGLEQLEYNPEVVRALKELQLRGFGRFVPGRYRRVSRFVWATADESSHPPTTAPPTGRARELTHAYRLRPDLEITMTLPENLTRAEAGRLARFVETLPFDQAPASPSAGGNR